MLGVHSEADSGRKRKQRDSACALHDFVAHLESPEIGSRTMRMMN